ncbi:isoamylase 2, chloroplastic [Cornus florida]|uniref:isoamylase 2, chloroplastic n=1 Tax=Cornus florida TaxID=4283 RepID=UPI00289D2BE9|nr:isoamylase 2, chloroplastic [Cornus florida]
MATLPLSFVIQSHFLTGATTQYSKLIAAAHYNYGKKITHSLKKMDRERNLVCEEIVNSSPKISSQYRSLEQLSSSQNSVVQTEERSSTYLFRTETGGQVKVFVGRKNTKYVVQVEVSNLQLRSSNKDKLVMSWGIFRSDSSLFMPLGFQNSSPDARSGITETSFVQKSSGKLVVELDFESSLAPFYLSFLLKSPLEGDSRTLEIRSHRNKKFCFPVGFGSGCPAPLGLSFSANGSMNFALFSRNAESVVLCLYDDTSTEKPALEIDLDPYVNRSGDIWHVSMDSEMHFVGYGYRCKRGVQQSGDKFQAEHILLDPYAKISTNFIPAHHGSGLLLKYLGLLDKVPAFDWSGDIRPGLPMEKLVVYRLNVMRFTKDKSSKLANNVAGTFSGITEKLHHFKDLGVNAILLEPISLFDEQKGPYFPCHFFLPMNLYGPPGDPLSTINSIKEMVKKLHANGMEVFLEVVFTHTAEGGVLREIDNSSYYYGSGGKDLKARNALNCNYPIVQQMILDSLRHWVIEFHIDGFCFINASYLLRGFHGEMLSRPPLVEAIAFDPLLSKAKIIADCWDPNDMAPKEVCFPHWKRWAEINNKFCDDVRNFLRGEALLSDLATRLCGSGDRFLNGRGPAFSFNFIARNSGLALVDLVSFSTSELASQLSWNCGEEGLTSKTTVLERRLKQIRNFLFILFVSLGVPILNMGDECGQSSGGSPAYKDRKSFDWNALGTAFAIQTTQFISFLSSLRVRRSDLLQKRNFLKEENIDWHGSDQSPPRWDDPSSRFLSMTLKADKEESKLDADSSHLSGDLFIAVNAADHPESVILPPPPAEMVWLRLVDTALPFPGFFSKDGEPILEKTGDLVTYEMKSHSCILFEAKSLSD